MSFTFPSAVLSVTGTANQIAVSSATGAPVFSFPATGLQYTVNNTGVVADLQNQNAGGFGLKITNGLDTNFSIGITNAANSVLNIQLFGNGNGTFAGTLAGNLVVGNAIGQVFFAGNSTTQASYAQFANTGGNSYFGISNSTGSTFNTGNYAAFVYTPTEFDVMIGGVNLWKVTASGVSTIGTAAFTGDLAVGASGTGAVNNTFNIFGSNATGHGPKMQLVDATSTLGELGSSNIILSDGSRNVVLLANKSLIFYTNNNAAALTLDTSQNASFASVVAVGGASLAGGTALITPAGAATFSSLRVPHGSAPTSPVNGDMWTTTAGLFIRINGATVGPLS